MMLHFSVITFMRFAMILQAYLVIYFVIYVYVGGGICGRFLDYGRCHEHLPPEAIYSVNSRAYWKVKRKHLLPYLCEHLYAKRQFLTNQ